MGTGGRWRAKEMKEVVEKVVQPEAGTKGG